MTAHELREDVSAVQKNIRMGVHRGALITLVIRAHLNHRNGWTPMAAEEWTGIMRSCKPDDFDFEETLTWYALMSQRAAEMDSVTRAIECAREMREATN